MCKIVPAPAAILYNCPPLVNSNKKNEHEKNEISNLYVT